MKKVLAIISILLSFTLILVSFTPVYATEDVEDESKEVLESDNASDFYKIKEEARKDRTI